MDEKRKEKRKEKDIQQYKRKRRNTVEKEQRFHQRKYRKYTYTMFFL